MFVVMTTIHSYRAEDHHGNIYLCNHEFNLNTNEHRIKLGANRFPCIEMDYDATENRFVLADVLYDSQCSYNELARKDGTKSMIYTALCITKKIYPRVETFILQDNSGVTSTTGTFNLSEYYLLTRGITWYQTFLPLRGDANVERLYEILSETVTLSPKQIADAYKVDIVLVQNVYNACASHGKFTWHTFHLVFFDEHPELRTNNLFKRIISYHTSNTFATKIWGAKYTGKFTDINCIGILGLQPIETSYMQSGGGNIGYSPQHQLLLSDEDLTQ